MTQNEKKDIDKEMSEAEVREYFSLQSYWQVKRRCLSCEVTFLSDWNGNRLCKTCKTLYVQERYSSQSRSLTRKTQRKKNKKERE